MGLSALFTEGYRRVQAEFGLEQDGFLRVIAEARNMPVEWIKQSRGLFIPNDEFMLEIFGKEIFDYDCYRGSNCVWCNALIFPIQDINGIIVGFAGFYPFEYLAEEAGKNYYAYSSQQVMQKGRYLFFPKYNLMEAVDAGYLLLVDGIFDSISLSGVGYHAAALMGSSPTQQIMMQLRFIELVVLISDNDDAGYLLFDKLRKHLNNVVLFKQGKAKDVDEVLKGCYSEKLQDELNITIRRKGISMNLLDV